MKHSVGLLVISVIYLKCLSAAVIDNRPELKIPDYLKICHKSDPKLNECIKESIEMLKPKIANGISDLLVPPCHPLEIPIVKMKQNAGSVSLESEYTNILVYGLTNFTLRSVRVDPDKYKFRIKLWFPDLQMTANYNIHGKLLMLPLAGQGPCRGNFTDIEATVSIKATRTVVNNKEYLKVNDLFIDFNIGTALIHFDQLFNGDAELGEAMNSFLNENWRSVATEMRPAIEDAIANILQGTVGRFFDAYTIDQLLPE